MTVKKGYILLTDTGTVLAKLIKFYTKKPFNHASITFDSELNEVYSFGRKSAANPFVGGFAKEDMKTNLFNQANCAIYCFEGTEHQFERMQRYIKNIEAQEHQYRYNLLGLFGFILNKPIKRNKAFFCSQFVATVLKQGNLVEFEKPLALISPNDLKEVFKLHLVYQGKLKDYTKNLDENARYSYRFFPIGV